MRRRAIQWQTVHRGKNLGTFEAEDYATARYYTVGAIQTGALPPGTTVHPMIGGKVYPIETFLPAVCFRGDLHDVYPGNPPKRRRGRAVSRLPASHAHANASLLGRTRSVLSLARVRMDPAANRMLGFALLGIALIGIGAWSMRGRGGMAGNVPADEGVLPIGLDTMVALADVVDRLERCDASPALVGEAPDGAETTPASYACAGAIYVWSPEMPLSRSGIAGIAAATDQLGIDLHVVPASELYAFVSRAIDDDAAAPAPVGTMAGAGVAGDGDPRARQLASDLIARGATIHFPAVIPYRAGEPAGTAIVGYKTAAAYRAMLRDRLDARRARLSAATAGRRPDEAGNGAAEASPAPRVTDDAVTATFGTSRRDYPVPGEPGPYFRWVPGRNAIAFESGRVVYLLELETGDLSVGPGYIDFVPSPDGRFFVTPKRDRGGLEFYDAATVFREARRGRGQDVEPVFVDPEMRDQYPSVGVLRVVYDDSGPRTIYRVLTSWFDKVVFRDYEITAAANGDGGLAVRPLGPPKPGCANLRVSLPIMAPDGRQLAGRDEASATTKLFRLDEDGRCSELADLRMQTGKVAWRGDSRLIAFAIPRRPALAATAGATGANGSTGASGAVAVTELAGLFVFDREEMRLTRVPGTERIERLAFPEFVGDSAVMFLLNQEVQRDSAKFRLLCCG